MATAYQWADLLLKNSKVIIALYVAVFGLAGYTVYDKVGSKPVEIEVEQAVESIKPHTHTYTAEQVMQDHVKEFH